MKHFFEKILAISFCFFCFGSFTPNSFSAGDSPKVLKGHEKADLTKMDLCIFDCFEDVPDFGKRIMAFLGYVIIFAAVLGFMIGGGMMVFSAGDEGMVSRGKDIMVASVVGLSVTLLSYAIVTLVQSLFYSIDTVAPF